MTDRVILAVDRKGWRNWARLNYTCLGLTIGGIAVAAGIRHGPLDAFAMTGILTMLLAPLLWSAWFASLAARSESWLDLKTGRLTLHHPVFLSADLELRDVTLAFYVGDASGYAKPTAAAPDVFSVLEAKRWSLVLVFREPFFLGPAPRRSIGVFRLLSRWTACAQAPRRNRWIRGLYGVVEDQRAAAAALEMAGVERLRELSPEVLRSLATER